MIVVKDKFILLRDVPNILSLSSSTIRSNTVEHGKEKTFMLLDMIKAQMKHFTKDAVFKLGSNKKEPLYILRLEDYTLPVTYDRSSDSIVINITPFGVSDISPMVPGVKNLYACLVYGICFRDLIKNKAPVDEKYAQPIIEFLTALFLRLFGKDYGLLGSFVGQIATLKFLTSCYIYDSFFGIRGQQAIQMSFAISHPPNYESISEKLPNYDFSDISNFIQSLSDFNVMSGINKHTFTAKILRMYSFNFLPALEDLSRFVAILTTSDINGTNIVPTYLSRANDKAFRKILNISKYIF
jgi:hypothetical protein